ncbi:hypothetical protein [Dactylosporangium sp. CS-033363]|uniref:hypothetical protein n=1 Tax=Dactylosporangium sp. CS-033363 TaxID=3239935 RepID=UPI003D905C21
MPEQPASMPEILAPAPVEVPRAEDPDSVPSVRRRPNILALSLLAVGFGLAIAAQYLPWGSFALGGRSALADEDAVLAPDATVQRSVDVPLTYLSGAHVTVYLLTLAGALTAIAVVLAVAGPAARRIGGGVAGGLLAANVLVLVGLKSVIDHMGNGDFSFLLMVNPQSETGPGYLLAYATALVLAAALVVAVRVPSAGGLLFGPRRAVDEPPTGEPLELTVTPVPPTFQ